LLATCRNATAPAAHALPDISAACMPAVIQDLARRSGVIEVDLNTF